MATTLNVAVAPAVTLTLLGWVVITGFAAEVTVSVAALVTVVPAAFFSTHRYCRPV